MIAVSGEVGGARPAAEAHGRVDAGVWAAPARANLIGEHTDYNEGYVLPFALPHRTTVAARYLADPRRWTAASSLAPGVASQIVIGRHHLVPGRVTGWAGYVAGVIWALVDAGYDVPAADLVIDSDVPVGAGLSSSAALECAVLSALCDLGGLELAVPDRPRMAQRAENAYVGVPCGIMDQTASTLCREGHALFLDCRSLTVEHIPFDLAADDLAVLIIDSRAPHRHADNEYAARRHTCEQAARAVGVAALRDINVDGVEAALAALPDAVARRRVRHVVTENARVLDTVALLRAGRLRDIGPLLTSSHVSMRDDYEITVPEVDLAVEVALATGAYGARMTGGGFGGCVLALVDTDAIDAVSDAVTRAYADRGYASPHAFVATASAGAHRVS